MRKHLNRARTTQHSCTPTVGEFRLRQSFSSVDIALTPDFFIFKNLKSIIMSPYNCTSRFIKTIYFFVIAVTMLVTGACKKDRNAQVKYNVSAKVDGKLVTFNTQNSASLYGSNDTFFGIAGMADDGSLLYVNLYGAVEVGTYTYNSVSPGKGELHYITMNQAGYASTDDNSAADVIIKVTSKSDTTIAGTFSGTVREYINGIPAQRLKTLSEGQFNVKIAQ